MIRPALYRMLLLRLGLLCCSLCQLQAQTFGLFTYKVVAGATVEITGYAQGAVGQVDIPATIAGRPVTSIGFSAFSNRSGLTSVTFPSTLTSISNGAFAGCSGLTSIAIPSTVVSISTNAFAVCNGLTSVTLGFGVTTIGHGAFYACIKLASLSLPSSLKSIGDEAFLGCVSLTSISLPSSLTKIGSGAFSSCVRLNEIILPSSLTSIGTAPFRGCRALDSIGVDSANQQFTSVGGVLLNAAQTILLHYPAGKAGSYTLPSSITTVNQYAFAGSSALTSVNLPSTVTSIGEGAFSSCSALDSILAGADNPSFTSVDGVLFNAAQTALIQYPAGRAGSYTLPSHLNTIQSYAFSGCTRLTNLFIPSSVMDVAQYAFSGCTGLIDVTLSNSIVALGDSAFSDCTGLTDVTLPNSLLALGASAFSGCSGLIRIALPSSLNKIERNTFFGCRALTSLDLPSGLTMIGESAFRSCGSLAEITLPSRITNIGDSAFSSCSILGRVIFSGDAPTLGAYAFYRTEPSFAIYYLSSRTGFTSPTWNGVPAIMIDEATAPAASWLLEYGLSYNTDLQDDRNGDGVTLLMAYALNLDPRLNLQDSLPQPALGVDTLQLSFHATSQGITYRVETSTDLQSWTTEGVTLSPPGIDHKVTASVPRDTVKRYLRLIVED